MRFANQMGIQLFETSAKENINVEEMFRAITNLVLNSKKAQRETLGDPATGRIKVNDHVRPHKRGKDKKMCCNQPKNEGRGAQWDQIEKKSAKNWTRKFVTLTDHTCVCNDLTNFEYGAQVMAVNGTYVKNLSNPFR